MQEFSFRALGTHWSLLVDTETFPQTLQTAVLDFVSDFERRFSRFVPTSEVNVFRMVSPGEYTVSEEFLELFSVAERLRELTGGAYDPAIGGFLESVGYGGKGQGSAVRRDTSLRLPHWSLINKKICVDGPVAFDVGGIGKGYCIDRIADILRSQNFPHFIVDGGGDMVASVQSDGSPWKVAIEYPGKPDLAAGTVALAHQGLAVSDGFRRRFGVWHHLVHGKEYRPIQNVIGCAAVARDAWAADCMTSGLFFASPARYPDLLKIFDARYLIFYNDGTVNVSENWKGELF